VTIARMPPPPASPLNALDTAPPRRWLNAEPLTAAALRGRVVAVQFGTYSCVNWIRTLPYVRAWVDRYGEDGLVVVGAHTPEFAFETEIGGVRRALAAMRVVHPVVLDDDYAIWRAFDNHYWPALYVLDRDGRVAYRHFGEGSYEESETAIRELLGGDALGRPPVAVEAVGVEAAADWDALRSPETYVGRARGERRVDEVRALNDWTLHGAWALGDEHATLQDADGSIAYRFAARDLNLVLTPPPGAAVPFTVRVDSEAPGDAHGVDVAADGTGAVDVPRLYQLVRQPRPGDTERTFSITFHVPGVRAYVFTFG
jgi:thiol-disulfide isomerase/thioredoxin